MTDGSVVPDRESELAPAGDGSTPGDGFMPGDGVFEAVKVVDGVPFALTRHLRRLAASVRELGLGDPDVDAVRAAVVDGLGSAPRAPRQRLRVTYAAVSTTSGRGDCAATLMVTVSPLGDWPPTTSVVTVPWPRNVRGATVGMKTTSYAENALALTLATARGATEAIFGNTRGELCEGTGSNVVVAVGGRLLTPPLASGCLPGVTRGLLLDWGLVEEATLDLSVLTTADEVALASTTRDVHPVHAVDGRELAAPGPLTRRAMDEFARLAADQVDP